MNYRSIFERMRTPGSFPLPLVALLLTGCGLFGGGGSDTPSAPPVVTLPPPSPTGFVFYKEDSAVRDSLRVVARTPLEWRQIWDHIHHDEPAPPPMPEVDFSTHMLGVAAAGPRRLGDEIQVDSVMWQNRQLAPDAPRETVMVLKVRKLRSCDTYDVTVHPVVVVRVPAFDGRVEWQDRAEEERTDCR